MADPASSNDTTPRHSLPFLFAGQSQKEFTVNEALARIDFLLQPAIAGELGSPPPTPVAGDCYIVASNPDGEFTGKKDAIASWDGQQWSFAVPHNGMKIFDTGLGAYRSFDGQWTVLASPAAPSGGATVDDEARQAVQAILDALRSFGILG
ncbi:DUF2793 domain-containing protein [Qipengyuania sphaerica]|uniref:DUF2793 domain-containing protein n=1 Tax=Qipengyuania sphaerica TaxID=2867243 RepID=UPI001C86CB47|nr:DUF2793 domain-containing protein [Qipengyuania sphaerica]MBX7541372.1 DUF2793 domain-containing protein [Qipengyuania sphaerica]